MILRTWTARTTPDRLDRYLQQVKAVVIPHLRSHAGFRGAEFATRRLDEQRIEVLVITRWESTAALARFADGGDAWLPDEITATLLDADKQSLHYEQVLVAETDCSRGDAEAQSEWVCK